MYMHGMQVRSEVAVPPELPQQLQDSTAQQAALQRQLAQLTDAGLLTDVSRCS